MSSSSPSEHIFSEYYHPFQTQVATDRSAEFGNGVRSFSGTDITVYIFLPYTDGYNKLGSLRMLSWGSQRTKAMVTSLGKAAGVGYSRGVRIITGVMEFLQLDRSAFTPLIDRKIKKSVDSPYKYTNLPDELPPFDLLLCYVSETGSVSYKIIKHVEIVSSQGTDSIDNMNPTEMYSFVALGMTPLMPMTPSRTRPIDTQEPGTVVISSQIRAGDTISSRNYNYTRSYYAPDIEELRTGLLDTGTSSISYVLPTDSQVVPPE